MPGRNTARSRRTPDGEQIIDSKNFPCSNRGCKRPNGGGGRQRGHAVGSKQSKIPAVSRQKLNSLPHHRRGGAGEKTTEHGTQNSCAQKKEHRHGAETAESEKENEESE